MKNKKRQISGEELDALLSGSPITPAHSFTDKTVIKAAPATDLELNALLSADLINISADFTDRTLTLIEQDKSADKVKFPPMRWILRSGIVAAILLVGLFSYSIWNEQFPNSAAQKIMQPDLAGMELEELLFLEETLTSAKVLIELEKTVPLSYFIDKAD